MKALHLLLVLSLASVPFALTEASAARCVVGDDPAKCLVSVQWVVCVTEPCDGLIVCVGHGLACTNRLP